MRNKEDIKVKELEKLIRNQNKQIESQRIELLQIRNFWRVDKIKEQNERRHGK